MPRKKKTCLVVDGVLVGNRDGEEDATEKFADKEKTGLVVIEGFILRGKQ